MLLLQQNSWHLGTHIFEHNCSHTRAIWGKKSRMVSFKDGHTCSISSGRPKEEFCASAESRKRTPLKSYFLQKYRKNRKRLFLPKDPLSAKIASFGREKLFFWPTFGSKFLPKDCLSAEIASSCWKSLFLQKDQKAQKLQKDFLPNFCRNTLSVDHYH